MIRFFLLFALMSCASGVLALSKYTKAIVTPAATGTQIVRISLPLSEGLVHPGDTVLAMDGKTTIKASFRPLTWYPTKGDQQRSVRRGIVTFPCSFKTLSAVEFTFKPSRQKTIQSEFPVTVQVEGETIDISYKKGPSLRATLIVPSRSSVEAGKRECVESNPCFKWDRVSMPDKVWPRIIETRVDSLGQVVVVAHIQRNLPGDDYAPEIAWDIRIRTKSAKLDINGQANEIKSSKLSHPFNDGKGCTLLFDDGHYQLYQPATPFKLKGGVDVEKTADNLVSYRYERWNTGEKVPMQESAWQRVEFVVSPSGIAELRPSLSYPTTASIDWSYWDRLYETGKPADLSKQPELAAALKYHHDVVTRLTALGDDWGNVTSYNDRIGAAGSYAMNRLNHCAPIFREGWLSGDSRLTETALLWCYNFIDQSIWWGEEKPGGTRYNNASLLVQDEFKSLMKNSLAERGSRYMWRSNKSWDFCTKGFDAFFLAYEETGDPVMLETLNAQVAYSRENVHTNRGEQRNIGDVRDLVRLYKYTGDTMYLGEALRLYRELQPFVWPNGLFDQNNLPYTPNPPFIETDNDSDGIGFAKPYMIGYALSGLPELYTLTPNEPRLREEVQAVADFLAESQDQLGGWGYPHPRSSHMHLGQALEQVWEITQADRVLGVQEKHLDAIERALRQRILGWKKTGRTLSGLRGWESSQGQRVDMRSLYAHPEDRTHDRDYSEGRVEIGGDTPDSTVYFPEVLTFYLAYRPASRLLSPPTDDEPLGKVLSRLSSPKIGEK